MSWKLIECSFQVKTHQIYILFKAADEAKYKCMYKYLSVWLWYSFVLVGSIRLLLSDINIVGIRC